MNEKEMIHREITKEEKMIMKKFMDSQRSRLGAGKKVSKEEVTQNDVMGLEDKIDALNEYCKHSLSITCYTNGWEISSYKRDTLFTIDSEHYQRFGGYLRGKTLTEAINKAYELMLEDMK